MSSTVLKATPRARNLSHRDLAIIDSVSSSASVRSRSTVSYIVEEKKEKREERHKQASNARQFCTVVIGALFRRILPDAHVNVISRASLFFFLRDGFLSLKITSRQKQKRASTKSRALACVSSRS